MGIKDNFSQAVKELWKNDRLDDSAEASAPQSSAPSQLDRYLAQQDEATLPLGSNAQSQQPVQQAQQEQAPTANQETNTSGVPLETPYYRPQTPEEAQAQPAVNTQAQQTAASPAQSAQGNQTAQNPQGGFGGANSNYGGFGGFNAPPAVNAKDNRASVVTDEVTVISKNTVIDGNVRSLANMQVDGNVKGNIETTRDIEMTGKVVGDVKCNNASMNSAAMQGNMTIKGKMRMDRDTILIGDLSSQYADVNGRIRGKLEIAGKAELKRDAIVFGDINASTIAVTDGAIIQGYVNTTFLSKEDSRNAFPDAISLDSGKETAN